MPPPAPDRSGSHELNKPELSRGISGAADARHMARTLRGGANAQCHLSWRAKWQECGLTAMRSAYGTQSKASSMTPNRDRRNWADHALAARSAGHESGTASQQHCRSMRATTTQILYINSNLGDEMLLRWRRQRQRLSPRRQNS